MADILSRPQCINNPAGKQAQLRSNGLYWQRIWWPTRPHQTVSSLQWRHNGGDSVSNHQPHDCLLNRLFRSRSKKTSKLRVTGLCMGNSPGTGEFPAQMASYAENVSIWWRHHVQDDNPQWVHIENWTKNNCDATLCHQNIKQSQGRASIIRRRGLWQKH